MQRNENAKLKPVYYLMFYSRRFILLLVKNILTRKYIDLGFKSILL